MTSAAFGISSFTVVFGAYLFLRDGGQKPILAATGALLAWGVVFGAAIILTVLAASLSVESNVVTWFTVLTLSATAWVTFKIQKT